MGAAEELIERARQSLFEGIFADGCEIGGRLTV
jgi:hypothetical protein